MKRDMDLVRAILLAIEGGQNQFVHGMPLEGSEAAPDAVIYHLRLMEQAGLVEVQAQLVSGITIMRGLTWEGHELIDAIRDPEIWRKTKAGIGTAGGWTLGFLKDMGSAYLKHMAKERLGLDL